MARLIWSIWSTLIIALVPLLAVAAEVEGVSFEQRIVVKDTPLKLVGAGLLRYFGFRAYAGALYVDDISSGADMFAGRAKRIEIEYFRSIKGEDFGPATIEAVSKNVSAELFERLRSRIDYHNSLYEDVEAGDRYSLTYIPGIGTELALNGESKGVIPGEDFAEAIFSIWIGPEPISGSFKKQLLGYF